MLSKFLVFFFILQTYSYSLFSQDTIQEMRAMWIATAKNIDYPSKKTLSVEQQKAEFIEILDLYKKVGINAVVFQVRPAADAFFPSPYEPWSEWLTGKQGRAPQPYYDPLKFMIEESHKRGMEFHAWFNPFRAVANIETADIADNHITKTKPEWFFTYGINTYFNPGIPEVRDYVAKNVAYVVRNYDIDGVHFDDYFYPYPERDANKRIMSIPDFETFNKYGKSFPYIDDWRRNNMNVFIKQVGDSVKKIKPYIKYGIAPSGVWRNKTSDPKGSDTRGFEHYDYLYADVILWLKNGWIDYVAPQIYWNIGYKYADYKTLVEWWSKNTYGKHLYIGQGIYMADTGASNPAWRNPAELPNQMRINRSTPNVKGTIFYKTSALKRNPLGFNDSLQFNFFASNASVPLMEWLPLRDTIIPADTLVVALVDDVAPAAPVNLQKVKMGAWYMLSWDDGKQTKNKFDDKAVKYNVYKFSGFDSRFIDSSEIFASTQKKYVMVKRNRMRLFKKEFSFVVTALDKAGNESKPSNTIYIKLKK